MPKRPPPGLPMSVGAVALKPSAGLDRVKLARLGAAAVGLFVLVGQLVVWLPMHARRTETNLDWIPYFTAADHVTRGEPLYRECATYERDAPPGCYVYPPPLAVAVAPIALAGRDAFQTLWYAGLIVAFWIYAASLMRLAGFELTAANVLPAGVLLLTTPGVARTMSYGNADMWIWALCALAIGGGRWRGVIGAAAAFKVFPGWVVLASMARRERGWRAGAIAAGTCIAAALAVVGLAGFRQWSAAVSILASGPHVVGNVSLPVFVAGLVGIGGPPVVVAPFVGVPLVAFLLRRWDRSVREGLLLVTAVLLAPLCWWYYAPMALIPVAAVVRAWRAS